MPGLLYDASRVFTGDGVLDGIVQLTRPALTRQMTMALYARVTTSASAASVLGRAGIALVRPNPVKLVPVLGWAVTIGSVAWALDDAYNATEVDWGKLEGGSYSAEDTTFFRGAFTQARTAFLATTVGIAAQRAGRKFILIPSQVMPAIALVDTYGVSRHGNVLRWDPVNATSRRQAVMRGRARAGTITGPSGQQVRGSWEEYPFATTVGLGAPGVHVDRVPLQENWIQGGFINAARVTQNFVPGDVVHAYIM